MVELVHRGGGGDGTMKMRWLRTDPATAAVVPDGPFDHARPPLVLPRHNGMVVSLTGCRQNGLLLSGAQDGTLRVLDFCDDGGVDGGADGGGGGGAGGGVLVGVRRHHVGGRRCGRPLSHHPLPAGRLQGVAFERLRRRGGAEDRDGRRGVHRGGARL